MLSIGKKFIFFTQNPVKKTKVKPDKKAANNLYLGLTFLNKSSRIPDKKAGTEDSIIIIHISWNSSIMIALNKNVTNNARPPTLGVGFV